MTGADDVRTAMGVGPKPAALRVRCPHCRAGPGDPCLTLGRPRGQPHPGRTAAANLPPAPSPPQPEG